MSGDSCELSASGPGRPVQLLVCTKCRRSEDGPDPEVRAGARLFERLSRAQLPEGASLVPVECLSNCSQSCTIALRGPARWSYVYGNLVPEGQEDTILDGLTRYVATPDGLVPWRERPVHFRKNCIARLPPED